MVRSEPYDNRFTDTSPGSDPYPLPALRELNLGGELIGAHPVQPHGVQEVFAPGVVQPSLPPRGSTTSRPTGDGMPQRGHMRNQEPQQPDTVRQKEKECQQGDREIFKLCFCTTCVQENGRRRKESPFQQSKRMKTERASPPASTKKPILLKKSTPARKKLQSNLDQMMNDDPVENGDQPVLKKIRKKSGEVFKPFQKHTRFMLFFCR